MLEPVLFLLAHLALRAGKRSPRRVGFGLDDRRIAEPEPALRGAGGAQMGAGPAAGQGAARRAAGLRRFGSASGPPGFLRPQAGRLLPARGGSPARSAADRPHGTGLNLSLLQGRSRFWGARLGPGGRLRRAQRRAFRRGSRREPELQLFPGIAHQPRRPGRAGADAPGLTLLPRELPPGRGAAGRGAAARGRPASPGTASLLFHESLAGPGAAS